MRRSAVLGTGQHRTWRSLARCFLAGGCLGAALALLGAAPPAPAPTAAPEQSEADEYTRYELLDPGSAQFHILYEVTATTPGAQVFFNPIRPGSAASGEAIFDRASGQRLTFSEVTGEVARREGVADAEPTTHFIRIELPRPVPSPGGSRLLIEKTYRDPKSYFIEGDRIVFARSLGIRRNAVVLPLGYELSACNIPAQVATSSNGRVVVSFTHPGPEAAAVVIKGRKLP